jgi:gamma-glutamyltranspeptidase
VAAPRFHHQWPPRSPDADLVSFERGLEPDATTRATLETMGYTIEPRGPLGDVHAIEIEGRSATGTSDPRGIGHVASEALGRTAPSGR